MYGARADIEASIVGNVHWKYLSVMRHRRVVLDVMQGFNP